MALLQILRPTLPILIGASIMLTISMGLRQSLGLFMQPLTQDIRISVSDFTLALAVQNLAWGFLQPFAGALTVRYGFRAIMVAGALLYIAGLALHGGRERFSQRHDRRRRFDRHVAGLHRGGDRDVGCGPRGACVGALDGARPGVGCGIARRAAVGAARPDPQRGLWLANGARRFCGAVAADDSRCLVRGQGRQDPAAQARG